MAAITWRTLMGASPSEASRGFESAQRSIAGAFDQLGGLIKGAEAFNQKQADTEAEGRVQGFLDRIQGARTPEAVAALQASGELDTLRAALKPADLARVRGAEEARTTALRQGVVAENTFNDQLLARQRAPLINEAKMFVANNDRAGLNAFLAKHDLGDEATFLTQLQASERAGTEFGWKKAGEAHAAALRPGALQAQKMGIAASQEQINASRESRDLASEQRAQLKAAAKVAAEEQALKERGNTFALEGVFGPSRVEEVSKLMVDAGIGDDAGERQAVIRSLLKRSEGGTPLPMSVVKEAVLGANDEVFSWWNKGYANGVETNLDTIMKRQRAVELANGKTGEANAIDADYQEWLRNRQGALSNPVPSTGKKK